ncbi:MAG: cytochrome c biogenesis protein CcdA [Balneolaceae bacterium]|nr:cytochrome c biogenesis protein CcdA [Balneolaceae bacterium]
MRWAILWALSTLAVLSAQPSHAQLLDPVKFTVGNVPTDVTSGQSIDVSIETTIDGKWHLYAVNLDPDSGPIPTQFGVVSDGLLQLSGDVSESEPDLAFDPNFDAEVAWHTSEASFDVPVLVGELTENTIPVAAITVRYQVCDDRSCLPPKTKTLEVPIQRVDGLILADRQEEQEITVSVEEGVLVGGESSASTPSPRLSPPDNNDLAESGWLAFIWIALTAGFAALLTPCVFPMVPLTVSYFTKQSPQDNAKSGNDPASSGAEVPNAKRGSTGPALLFGLFIVASFTLLGVFLSLVIGVSGANQFAANPWINLFIGGVLLLFGLSLLGFFELQLPHQFTNWLNAQSNEKGGWVGILFMALTISAVSFSCTAPFVGAVIAATATGQWFAPIIGMVAFSAAFASPFVMLAIFPSWLESLPKSGTWMTWVKIALGFIELAAAVKFISNADLVWQWGIVSRPFAISIWIALSLLAAGYFLGLYAMGHEKRPASISMPRFALSLPFLVFSIYLVPGLLGASLGLWDAWLPPKQATDVSVVRSIMLQTPRSESGSSLEAEEGWLDDLDEALSLGQQTGEPIFVDFTGYTCTNCRAMETQVFPLDEVSSRFENFIKVRLYTDDGIKGPELQKRQFELTGTVALPTYVLLDGTSSQKIAQVSGYLPAEEFISFLDKGIDKEVQE